MSDLPIQLDSKFRSPQILIINKGFRVLTWCADLQSGFQQIGCDVRSISLRSENWFEKYEKWSRGYKHFENHSTLERCKVIISSFKPDLVILLNFAGIPKNADMILRKAAGSHVPIIGWLADHIFNLPKNTLPNLDGVAIFDSATLDILKKIYQSVDAKLEFLPLAVNPSRYPDCSQTWIERRSGMAFVGNNTTERRALIREYRDTGGSLTAYGPKAETGMKFWRGRPISPPESARIYGRYQFSLNLLQPPNTIHGLNLRAYEIPASGGLGTYPLTPDVSASFTPHKEIIAYRNMKDLANQTRELLRDPERCASMIAASRKRVLAEHTYAHRALQLIKQWLPNLADSKFTA